MCTTGHKSDEDCVNADSEASSQDVGDHAYDSTFEELMSSTRSLTAAEYLFEKRNGRTYHLFQKDLEYVLPNDEPERDRLDMQFWAIHEVLGEYFFAPIGPHPQNILDVGTGTGLWVIDVADSNPGAIVNGTDLSPIQPNWIPANAVFELHDCLQYPWDFGKEFDLIHTQAISGFAVKNWEEFYREAFRNLRPGGWVESHEFDMMVQTDDDSLPKPSAIVNWLLQFDKGAGGGFRLTGQQLADALRQVGFVDIVVKEFKLPVGTWMKEQLNSGLLTLTAMTEHIEGLSNRIFMDKLGMTEEQMKAQIEPAVKEWKKSSVHTYWPMYAVYGRRPEAAAKLHVGYL